MTQGKAINHEVPTEESLDHQDWESMRKLGKQMVDDMVNYLQSISDKPAWQEIPKNSKDHFQSNLPLAPSVPEDIYAEFTKHILPYPTGNIHPRFFSWVQGNGTLMGAFADFLASSMNPNSAIGEHAAMYVEEQVLNWSKEIMGYPKTAGGILLSGGSIANITGLMIARNNFSELNIRKEGLQKIKNKMVFYCSDETHSCLQKAAEAIGLGSSSVIKIPVNDNYQIRTDLLDKQIEKDKESGLLPFCIIANAGTVNTGNIDDLNEISKISKKHKLWLHIDGAYGALATITPEYKDQLKAMVDADSIAFDFHKWFYINYEVGCLLVRDGEKHRSSFAIEPNYLQSHDRGLASGPDPYNNWGMELSRGFKALKVWMSLKEHGLTKYQRLISQNIAQTKYLEKLLREHQEIEIISPANLSIICYRFVKNGLNEEELNSLNKELLIQLHEKGIATPSYTILDGKYVIRVCITNHRTKNSDLNLLAQESVNIGNNL